MQPTQLASIICHTSLSVARACTNHQAAPRHREGMETGRYVPRHPRPGPLLLLRTVHRPLEARTAGAHRHRSASSLARQ